MDCYPMSLQFLLRFISLGERRLDVELDFEKRYRLVREIIETVVLTVLMFLIIRLAVQNFNIDGMSMEPRLHNQELILVDKWTYTFHPFARGDVIVFVAPPNPTQDYIKRIVGLPGDVITIHDTAVYVNGSLLKEAYVDPGRQGNQYQSFDNRVIPPNAYFVLGDNRGGSSDSRDWGCVPRDNVIGRAALVYWPLGQDNNGLLANFSTVFNNIPAPDKKLASNTANMCPIRNMPGATSAVNEVQQAGVLNPSISPINMDAMLLLVMPGVFVGFSFKRKRRGNRL
jgi:signal peptidase I